MRHLAVRSPIYWSIARDRSAYDDPSYYVFLGLLQVTMATPGTEHETLVAIQKDPVERHT